MAVNIDLYKQCWCPTVTRGDLITHSVLVLGERGATILLHSAAQEEKTLENAAISALAPALHLNAASDTALTHTTKYVLCCPSGLSAHYEHALEFLPEIIMCIMSTKICIYSIPPFSQPSINAGKSQQEMNRDAELERNAEAELLGSTSDVPVGNIREYYKDETEHYSRCCNRVNFY